MQQLKAVKLYFSHSELKKYVIRLQQPHSVDKQKIYFRLSDPREYCKLCNRVPTYLVPYKIIDRE